MIFIFLIGLKIINFNFMGSENSLNLKVYEGDIY